MPLHLTLASQLESLQTLETFLQGVMTQSALDEDMRGNVMVSTMEAVTNAIRHGNKLNPQKVVRVEVERRPSGLQITVADEGSGFCPETVPDPTDPAFLLREGGRGVYLIQALADEVNFLDDGRCVEMCFACDCGLDYHDANTIATGAPTVSAA